MSWVSIQQTGKQTSSPYYIK